MNTKTLVFILHYNTPQYTDTLYEILKPYERDDYDLFIIDNGSDKEKTSQYTSFRVPNNTYYGGGLDISLNYFIENKQYDSMILLNSDLILHGSNFIKTLREELFNDDELMALSGCVLQPERAQCHWKMVHNWGSKTIRYVPWVDYQCVLIKRELAEKIGSFGSQFGWVQDVMTGIICEENNWKIGVCDWAPVIHFGNGTVKENLGDPIISNYNILAEQEMVQYFQDKGLFNKFLELRNKAENYENYKL